MKFRQRAILTGKTSLHRVGAHIDHDCGYNAGLEGLDLRLDLRWCRAKLLHMLGFSLLKHLRSPLPHIVDRFFFHAPTGFFCLFRQLRGVGAGRGGERVNRGRGK